MGLVFLSALNVILGGPNSRWYPHSTERLVDPHYFGIHPAICLSVACCGFYLKLLQGKFEEKARQAAETEAEKVQQGFLPFVGKNLVLWQRFEAAVAVAPSAGSGSCSVGSSGKPLRQAEPAAPTDAPS